MKSLNYLLATILSVMLFWMTNVKANDNSVEAFAERCGDLGGKWSLSEGGSYSCQLVDPEQEILVFCMNNGNDCAIAEKLGNPSSPQRTQLMRILKRKFGISKVVAIKFPADYKRVCQRWNSECKKRVDQVLRNLRN